MDIGTLTVLLVFGIPLAAIIGSFLIQALRVIKGEPGRRGRASFDEESRMIQAIYQQLSQMEDRIEALETLLLDRERKEGER